MPEKIHLSEPIILFDGVCNLCNGFVNFVIKIDKKAKIKFLPLQSPKAKSLLNKFPGNEMLLHDLLTVILIENGNLYFKSDAVLRVASHLPFPWKAFKFFRFVPGRLRDMIYIFISKHRYAWFGKKPQCMIPSPEIKKRFID